MNAHSAQPTVPHSPGSKPDPNQALKSMSMADLQAKLGSSPDGLTGAEAQKRLSQYGPNELEERKTNEVLKFLSYFWGPIPWMIEVAVILSAVAQHWPDFGIILLLLVANAVVGFWEEHQAGNAIAALKAKLAVKARVERDGKWVEPSARELVPGDVIRLRLGDIVPADARLLEGDSIEVDQSALTGESLPATRKPGEAVFSGSIVRQGEIGALVYATGAGTYFGKTAELVQEAHTVSHFQRAVLKIGNYLIILAVVLVAVSCAGRRDYSGALCPLPVSPGPELQREDALGHAVRLRRPRSRAPMGIDHSAVCVTDVAASERFYATHGLCKGIQSLNHGPTQAALDGLDDVEVDVVPMNPSRHPPHVELLGYRRPPPGERVWPSVNDVAATRIVWRADHAALLRDPDGHLHQFAR